MEFVDLHAQRRRLGDSVELAIKRVLDHGQFVMGPEVFELEERLAAYCGVKHAVSCASGTDALLLVLMAWGIRPGDAVFVPAFTFAATAEVVALLGATPVFVDVLPQTGNLDPAHLRRTVRDVESGPLRPAAVIPVDLFGHPADYEAVGTVAREAGMPVLADAAQSFGARRHGAPVGRFGDATATSFFPAKPLGCYGDGGAVLTDDDELAAVLRSLRVHGQGTEKYDNVRVGINGRLDTIQAAVLLQKLTIFDEELEARRQAALRYETALGPWVEIPTVESHVQSAWAQYTIKVADRARLGTLLREQGVPTAIYYPKALHRQRAYSDSPIDAEGLPVAEHLAEHVLSLPMHPYLSEADQAGVAAVVAAAMSA